MENNITIAGCEVTFNRAAYGAGVYVGTGHVAVAIFNTNFSANTGESGGGLYVDRFNELLLLDHCAFYRNSAILYGGGIMYLSYGLHLFHCDFRHNDAGDGGGLMIRGSDLNHVWIKGCSFLSNVALGSGGGLFMASCTMVAIDATYFAHNSASVGGGLRFHDLQVANISDCTLVNNSASGVGGGMFGSLLLDVHFARSIITGCTAYDGGGCFLESSDYVGAEGLRIEHNTAFHRGGGWASQNSIGLSFASCNFDNNVALIGNGGGIWLSGGTASFNTGNMYNNNHALDGGGGCLFWDYIKMEEPDGLHAMSTFDCDFSNQASYGSRVSTGCVHVVANPTSITLTGYDSGYIPPFSVDLEDYYRQRVVSLAASDSSITIYKSKDCSFPNSNGYIGGVITEDAIKGNAVFDRIEAYCAPGYEMGLNASWQSTDVMLSEYISIFYRTCNAGEYYADDICIACDKGSYSLQSNTDLSVTSCSPCPSNSKSCVGSSIEVDEGYWRISNLSSSLLACPYGSNSCAGGWSAGSASCKTGYEGALCAVCEDGYFYSTSIQKCTSCAGTGGVHAVTLILLVLVLVMMLAVIVGVLRARVQFKKLGVEQSLSMTNYIWRSLLIQMNVISKESSLGEALSSILKWKEMAQQMTRRIKVYTSLLQVSELAW